MTKPWVGAMWRGAWPSPAEQSPGQGCGPCLGLWLWDLLLLWSLSQFLGGIRNCLVMG